MNLIPQYRTSRRQASSFVGALDSYTSNLWAARWTKRLLTSYTGSLIRVRRSSDNAETDIGYESDGSLDDAAVLAHCGTDTGYVVTMYDQSGNSRNLTQSTAASQPRICASGAMLGAVGEHHGVRFDGTGTTSSGEWLNDADPSALASTAIELFGAIRNSFDVHGTEPKTGHPFNYSNPSGLTSHLPYTDGVIYDGFGTNVRKNAGNPSNDLSTASAYNCFSTASDWRLYVGGHTSTTTSNAMQLQTNPRVGKSNLGTAYQYDGFIAGCVIYSAAQSSRSTIRGLLLSGSG